MADMIRGQEVDLFRLKVLARALKLVTMGMTRRGQSAYAIVKAEFGFKGSKTKVLGLLEKRIELIQGGEL